MHKSATSLTKSELVLPFFVLLKSSAICGAEDECYINGKLY